jgi:hypothetical protein
MRKLVFSASSNAIALCTFVTSSLGASRYSLQWSIPMIAVETNFE